MYLEELLARIRPAHDAAMEAARRRQDRLTKPSGALGRLEALSVQLAGVYGDLGRRLDRSVVFVFAGDHGVTAEGVSAYPAEVTSQMVHNFVRGGAAVNVLARAAGAQVVVTDVGVAGPPFTVPGVRNARVRPGTGNLAREPAMSRGQAEAAVQAGVDAWREARAEGPIDIAIGGEMGIGNTTASSAIATVLLGVEVSAVTGHGTGVSEAARAHKMAIIERALGLHRPDPADPIGVLAAVGGLEIGALAGLYLAAAADRVPVLLDGFISATAALLAQALAPRVVEAMVASHRSTEPGHALILEHLGLRPLLELDLRLGEGSGALVALPVVVAAWRLLQEMATFEEAGVSDRDP